MPPRKDKNRQPSVENDEEEYGESGGEVVPSSSTPGPITTGSSPFIPGFSTQQINGMMTIFGGLLTTELDRRFGKSPTNETSTPQAVPATQPIAVQHDDKRWRPEEIGYFDGSGDVYAFTDRLTSIATSKSVKLVQTNLVTLFPNKDIATAFNWYHYELPDSIKEAYNTSTSINPWCLALIERFGPSQNDLITQLEECHYTRRDAANKKDATAYIQSILRITKGLKWPQSDGLMVAFHHFEPGLQRDLDPPRDLTEFIKQVQLRQDAWYHVYSTYGKSRPPNPFAAPNHIQPRQQQPTRPPYRPPQRPTNPYHPQQLHQVTDQQQPKVYWADQEEDEDWIYDPPTNSYHAAPAHPPGHTPRRQGNTHDGDYGNEAIANWANAGDSNRCNREGCTHYH